MAVNIEVGYTGNGSGGDFAQAVLDSIIGLRGLKFEDILPSSARPKHTMGYELSISDQTDLFFEETESRKLFFLDNPAFIYDPMIGSYDVTPSRVITDRVAGKTVYTVSTFDIDPGNAAKLVMHEMGHDLIHKRLGTPALACGDDNCMMTPIRYLTPLDASMENVNSFYDRLNNELDKRHSMCDMHARTLQKCLE